MFLQLVAQTYKSTWAFPVKIYSESGKIILFVNGETWSADNLDQCIILMKQSLSIKYLENLEIKAE